MMKILIKSSLLLAPLRAQINMLGRNLNLITQHNHINARIVISGAESSGEFWRGMCVVVIIFFNEWAEEARRGRFAAAI